MKSYFTLVITVVFAAFGIFYAALPHSIHVQFPLGAGLDHIFHIILGIILLIVAGVAYWKGK